MNKKLYNAVGMALLSLPSTKKDRTNNKHRNIGNIEATSAARMLSVTGVCPDAPAIICGRYNKALPVVRQLTKMSSRPFLILGTKRDLSENSCLYALETEWKSENIERTLPNGNGVLMVRPGAETNLALKEYLPKWDTHLIIICLGNGLQVDQELLNLLNSVGHYIILSETLQRSIKSMDGCKLTASELLSSMEYILVSSIGTAGKELLKVLPDFQYEKITNTTDFSSHQDSPQKYGDGHHHRTGGGFRFSQSKVLENRSILTQDELIKLQDSNLMLIHNTRCSHTWIAKITR